MARIPQLTNRDALPAEAHAAFDAITASRGNVRGPFAVLMHSPELAARVAHLGTYVRFESTLPPRMRELAVATAARECDCAYEWAAHLAGVKAAGISDATIDVVGRKAPVDGLPVEEQQLIRYVRELIRDHRATDETFATMHSVLGDQGMAELTATVGYYSLLACVLNAFEVAPGDGTQLPATS